MHAISQQLSPIQGCSGIELLEADTFDLHCFQSLTATAITGSAYKNSQLTEGIILKSSKDNT
ncbi:putative trafficking protein particle complex subunit [Helianthus annuus]|nr:putative trafficking protein particle complex subunit [Helianthus annuus]KAJ0507351.1 putative trafficking protein particle complex subunit [Helianthus annuus]KAJ0515854.1 putative trafficking protein particle complex subunit [Helianthus annuus]KAJ0687834.1 putative trafficking protein particle complex subunit [Helianthus annuus]